MYILQWRPRSVGALTVDPLLARKHREHHIDPRDVPLVFIAWQSLLWVLPLAIAIALLAFPRIGMGLTFLAFLTVLGLAYEWMHYLIHSDYKLIHSDYKLIHSDYKPKSRVYRAVWRHHRLHHFKNEHYWFTVTSSGTADRVLRTSPDPATVATSPTAKNLHGGRLQPQISYALAPDQLGAYLGEPEQTRPA